MPLRIVILALLGLSQPSFAQNPVGPCDALRAFAAAKTRHLPPGARCRPEPRAAQCLPGFKLKVDHTGDQDRCLDAGGTARGTPKCSARFAQRYTQRVVAERWIAQQQADGRRKWVRRQWAPGVRAGEVERLGVQVVVPQRGADPCIYTRVETISAVR